MSEGTQRATILEALATGLAHHQRGEMPQAESIYRQILAADSRNADALHLLGVLALNTNRVSDAISLIEQAIAVAPNQGVYYSNLGSAYLSACRNDEARALLDHAIRLSPELANAHYNLAVALYNLGRLDESVASYRRALDVDPTDVRTHNNLGNLFLEMGRLDESLFHLEEALKLDPQCASALYNRSLGWLKQGRLPEGWQAYESRWLCPGFTKRETTQPAWNGAPIPGQTLLVHAEQGLGDTIQFIRYLPMVRTRCSNVIVEVQPGLLPLFQQSGIRGLVAQHTLTPPFDIQLPMASLPGAFGTTWPTIPRDGPYLLAKPDLVNHWRQALSQFTGFKVGIVWQGSPTYREDRYRSIPLPYFAALARVPGVQLISLQKGQGTEQIAMLRNQFHVLDLGSRLDERAGPFMDCAAIMKCLDLVISADTVTVHLAGALGVKAWAALRIGADWRWPIGHEWSPWYPTVRMFRQRSFNDWPGVFSEMADELQRLV